MCPCEIKVHATFMVSYIVHKIKYGYIVKTNGNINKRYANNFCNMPYGFYT